MDSKEPKDYEDVAREMIRHEDEVINHRVGWLSAWNGLLFTALGILWDKPNNRWILLLICIIGCVFCLLSYLSLLSGTRALARIRTWWDAYKPKEYSGPGIMGLTALGPERLHWFANYCSQWDLMALVLLISWATIFLVLLFK